MLDRSQHQTVTTGLVPLLRTATVSSTGMDLSNADSATVLVIGGVCDTLAVFTPVLEESDALSSGYSAVAAGDRVGSFVAITNAVAPLTQKVGYLGIKKYIRVTATLSGTVGTGATFAVVTLTGLGKKLPMA